MQTENEQRKRKADDAIDEKKGDDKSPTEESDKKVKMSAEENAALFCFSRVINEAFGYCGPCGDMPKKPLKAQREYITSKAQTVSANHSFSVAKAVFYRSISTGDSAIKLKYGPRFNSSLLAEYLDCAMFTCLKKIFGIMDPSVDLDQNIEFLAESVSTQDNSHNQIAVLLVFYLLKQALWSSSVESVALNAYECLLLRDTDLPDKADLSSMLNHSSVKLAVNSDFSGGIPMGFLESPLRFTLFDGSPLVGKYAAGGLNIFKDTDIVDGMYELACAFADTDKSEDDVEDLAYELVSQITGF